MNKAFRIIAVIICISCMLITVSCTSTEHEIETTPTTITLPDKPGVTKVLPMSSLNAIAKNKIDPYDFDGYLYATTGFAFLKYGNYIIRYNLENEAFDKLVVFDNSNKNYEFSPTYSNNGQYILSFTYENQSHNMSGNKFSGKDFTLTNLKNNTSILLAEKYDDAIAELVKEFLPSDTTEYFDFEFTNDIYKTDLLAKSKCFDGFRNKTISHFVASDKTLYILTRDKARDYVKFSDLRLVVINLEKDKIIDDRYIIQK